MSSRANSKVPCETTSFFFSSRRRHTILQGDWSSDVCSSDLPGATDLEDQLLPQLLPLGLQGLLQLEEAALPERPVGRPAGRVEGTTGGVDRPAQIGRASCRGRVAMGGVGESCWQRNGTSGTR